MTADKLVQAIKGYIIYGEKKEHFPEEILLNINHDISGWRSKSKFWRSRLTRFNSKGEK